MGCYYCELCDGLKDDDYNLCHEWGDGLVCEDCHTEHTPEDWEDWVLTYWKKPIPDRTHDWELVHKDYDGAPDSGDTRAFTGPTIEDVYQQAIEYNEEQND